MTAGSAALLAIAAGAFVAIQSAMLGAANRHMNAIAAAAWVHLGGLLLLVALTFVFGRGPDVAGLRSAPWIIIAGFFGAGIVASIGAVVGPLGLAVTLTLLTGAQLLLGAVFDAVGITGEPIPVTPSRVIGVVLVVAGAYLLFARSS